MFQKICGCFGGCCPGKRRKRDFYAQFGVTANPSPGERLPFFEVFGQGEGVRLTDERTILLSAGYLYKIDYVFLAAAEPESYMQILPWVNGAPALLYSFFAPSGAFRNTSASAGFTLEALSEDVVLQLQITYPEQVRNIDISGAVSVTPVIARNNMTCRS